MKGVIRGSFWDVVRNYKVSLLEGTSKERLEKQMGKNVTRIGMPTLSDFFNWLQEPSNTTKYWTTASYKAPH
jgi:hypothetical protein